MGNAKHTPGPWCPVLYGYFYTLQIDDCYGSAWAVVVFHLLTEEIDRVESAKMHANAKLAAAAPELLAACQDMLESIAWHSFSDSAQQKQLLTAVINNATGGAQ
jgi:hypothetical protein